MTDARGRQLGMPRSEEAPQRDWGVVRAEELERIVVVSPHMDDAVLGLAQLLAAHPGATVVTVFAGPPDEYPAPMTWWAQPGGSTPGDDGIGAGRAEDTKRWEDHRPE